VCIIDYLAQVRWGSRTCSLFVSAPAHFVTVHTAGIIELMCSSLAVSEICATGLNTLSAIARISIKLKSPPWRENPSYVSFVILNDEMVAQG